MESLAVGLWAASEVANRGISGAEGTATVAVARTDGPALAGVERLGAQRIVMSITAGTRSSAFRPVARLARSSVGGAARLNDRDQTILTPEFMKKHDNEGLRILLEHYMRLLYLEARVYHNQNSKMRVETVASRVIHRTGGHILKDIKQFWPNLIEAFGRPTKLEPPVSWSNASTTLTTLRPGEIIKGNPRLVQHWEYFVKYMLEAEQTDRFQQYQRAVVSCNEWAPLERRLFGATLVEIFSEGKT